ncbi:polysaccharide biosynthesis/export family protein [Desulfoplanes sp.]
MSSFRVFLPFLFSLLLLFPASGATNPLPDFLLGPEDVLEISVWRDETLTRKVMIMPDGKFSFPLIGDIKASGHTVEEVRNMVQEKIKKYVPDAPVSVVMEEIQSPKVYIVGRVNKQGTFIMEGSPLKVVQLIALAGGLTPFAESDDIHVLRTTQGKQTAIPIDYERITQGENLGGNIVLQPGDTLVVP